MQHRFSYLLPVAAVLLPLAMLLLLPRWTVDDAYISYRYGAHLHQFGELSWNPGEAPVEGYTGVLLPLLASLLLSLGLPLLISVKVLSTMATCGTALVLLFALKKHGVSFPASALALLLFLTSPLVYVHQSSGLETTLFSFLIALSLHAHFLLISGSSKYYIPIVYLASLLALSICRPEGALLAGICLAGQLHTHWGSGKRLKGAVLFLLWLLPALAYMWWRTNYYGEWLPNSFAAKRSAGLVNVESINALARFAGQYLALPLASAGLLRILSADQQAGVPSKALRQLAFIFFIFLTACLLIYLRADLYMNYASRFFFPFFAPLLFACALLWSRGWEHHQLQRGEYPRRYKMVARLLLVFGLLQTGIFAFKWKGEMSFVSYYQSIVEGEYIPVAEALRAQLPADATLICYMDAGAIPFYSGLRTIDFGRLNDRYLAREKPDPQAVVDYFFAQKADAVVMTSEEMDRYVYLDEANRIMTDPRFLEYHLWQKFGNASDFPYFQWVFLRRDVNE